MTENNIDGLFQEMKELKIEVATLEEKIKSMSEEKLEFRLGDTYWPINDYGEVRYYYWSDDEIDNKFLKNNAIFKTQEAAEFEAERLKVLRELEKMGRAFRPHEDNYVISFSHNAGLKVVGYVTTVTSYGNYYFDSEEEAKQAVEKIGEERIKKYLFGVEE